MSNLIGKSLGRYHILEQLGQGGMAVVYKAYDTRLESDVAVKVIRVEKFTSEALERTLKRFEREAKSLAKLTHANIVKVTDYGDFEGAPYLVMPYLPGGNLKSKMKEHGRYPWREAFQSIVPVVRALEYAHSQNIVHRDVKPSNILITGSGDPMLTDFGVAKVIEEDITSDLTGTAVAVGTPEYMAPEQTGKKVDHRVDIYALGVVLYEMITGRRPYEADTPLAVLVKQASDPLPMPRQFVRDIPEEVEKVLVKALAKKPEDRYMDMSKLAAAMEKLLADAPRVKNGGRRSTRIDQKPGFKWIMALSAILVIVLTGIMWTLIGSGNGDPSASMIGSDENTTLPSPEFTSPSALPTSEPSSSVNITDTPLILIDPTQNAVTPTYENDQIVFVHDRSLFTVRPDGSTQTVITLSDPGIAQGHDYWEKTISPGKKYASVTGLRVGATYPRIHILDANSGELLYITDHSPGSFTQPAYSSRAYWDVESIDWSPDGEMFIFASQSGSYHLYLVNMEDKSETSIYDSYQGIWLAKFSPDGDKIAYVSAPGGDYNLFLIDGDGTGMEQITQFSQKNIVSINWSPDAKYIGVDVSHAEMNGYVHEYYIINLLTEEIIHLATSDSAYSYHNHTRGYWSPDGSKILLTSPKLMIFDMEGSLLFEMDDVGYVHWLSDSTGLICGSSQDGLFKLDLLSGEEVQLYDTGENMWITALISSPDNKKIVFLDSGILYVMNDDGSDLINLDSLSSNYIDNLMWIQGDP